MTVTAAQVAAPETGGNTSTGQTEKLIRAAHSLLDEHNVAIGPRRINRLARQYVNGPASSRCSFAEFFITALAATATTAEARRLDHARQAAEEDPLLSYDPLNHADPVGHEVQRHLDTERGWRA